MAVRLFIFIFLGGWLCNLALCGWLLWDDARNHKRSPPLSEVLLMVVGSALSWPLTVPLGLWAFVFGGAGRLGLGQGRDRRRAWPWWVTGLAVLLVTVMFGLWIISILWPD